MKLFTALFDRRYRGLRLIEMVSFVVLMAIVFSVYVFKTGAGAEGAKIADTTRQIAEEQRRVRLLKAELAHLQSPDRLERLSVAYLGMGPVDSHRETGPGRIVLAAPAPASALASAVPQTQGIVQ